jgi:glutamate-1-semialdehyde aminotransferase
VTSFERSREWWRRAQRVIPSGTQTLSKGPNQFVRGVTPIYLERGVGSHVWDVDGNEYVDYPMALGPVILGYAEPVVDEAIQRQLRDGITFTLMHPLEVEVAERIVALCPGVEAVRFAKSGSDALSAAVRAARALTGRDRVLVSGYHGWHDWYIGSTSRNRGVPQAVRDLVGQFDFNDLDSLSDSLSRWRGDVAAVVIEPSGADVPAPGFLEGVIDTTRRAGAISIFDEVITGFRLAPGGARERYGVIPDISCYGKALGNGMPISAVVGRWETMNIFQDVFVSGTHGGETLSLAAARAVLDSLGDGTVLRQVNALGQDMMKGLRAALEANALTNRLVVGGEPERAVVSFSGDDPLVVKSWIQQCLVEAGVLFNGSMFISARHTAEDIRRAVDTFAAALRPIATGQDLHPLLKGEPAEAVFRDA